MPETLKKKRRRFAELKVKRLRKKFAQKMVSKLWRYLHLCKPWGLGVRVKAKFLTQDLTHYCAEFQMNTSLGMLSAVQEKVLGKDSGTGVTICVELKIMNNWDIVFSFERQGGSSSMKKPGTIIKSTDRCTELRFEWLGWQGKLATSMYLQSRNWHLSSGSGGKFSS